MAAPHFYEQNVSNPVSLFILSEETSKHCIQVLRMKAGELLNLTDGRGNLFTAAIVTADKRQCEVKIVTVSNRPPATR